MKLFGSKFILDSGRKSYRKIALQKYFRLGHKHLPLGNRFAENEGFLFCRFQGS
jgi:hypothetical protein